MGRYVWYMLFTYYAWTSDVIMYSLSSYHRIVQILKGTFKGIDWILRRRAEFHTGNAKEGTLGRDIYDRGRGWGTLTYSVISIISDKRRCLSYLKHWMLNFDASFFFQESRFDSLRLLFFYFIFLCARLQISYNLKMKVSINFQSSVVYVLSNHIDEWIGHVLF